MDLCNVNDIIIIVYLCSIGLTNENNGRPWNKALLTSVKKLEQKIGGQRPYNSDKHDVIKVREMQ